MTVAVELFLLWGILMVEGHSLHLFCCWTVLPDANGHVKNQATHERCRYKLLQSRSNLLQVVVCFVFTHFNFQKPVKDHCNPNSQFEIGSLCESARD